MRYSIKYILLLVATSMITVSCDDFIDEQPISVITGQSFWQSEADAQAGIIGAYDLFQETAKGEFGHLIHWGEGRADAVAAGDNPDIIAPIVINDLKPSLSVGVDWGDLYRVINQASLAIKNIPDINMDSQLQEELLGEAYFLRALSYFYAVRVWGDVPLLTEPTEDANQDLKPTRTPKDQVYTQIGVDIDAALSRVPTGYGTEVQTRGRATIGAVKALKVDYLLWMARVENQSASSNLQAAADLADEVLTDGLYERIANYGDIFEVKNSSEVIFALQYDVAQQESFNYGADLIPAFGEVPFTGGKQYYQCSEKLVNAVPDGDLRKDAIFIEGTTRGMTNFVCVKFKGSPASGTNRNFDSNIILYRVGGLMLMRAEALNELGQTQDAIALVDDLRLRAGLPASTAVSQDEVRQAILDEHLVEMSFEGSRWFTLVRSGRVAEEVSSINSNDFSSSSKLLWPLSDASLRQNENLEQNSAYN